MEPVRDVDIVETSHTPGDSFVEHKVGRRPLLRTRWTSFEIFIRFSFRKMIYIQGSTMALLMVIRTAKSSSGPFFGSLELAFISIRTFENKNKTRQVIYHIKMCIYGHVSIVEQFYTWKFVECFMQLTGQQPFCLYLNEVDTHLLVNRWLNVFLSALCKFHLACVNFYRPSKLLHQNK